MSTVRLYYNYLVLHSPVIKEILLRLRNSKSKGHTFLLFKRNAGFWVAAVPLATANRWTRLGRTNGTVRSYISLVSLFCDKSSASCGLNQRCGISYSILVQRYALELHIDPSFIFIFYIHGWNSDVMYILLSFPRLRSLHLVRWL